MNEGPGPLGGLVGGLLPSEGGTNDGPPLPAPVGGMNAGPLAGLLPRLALGPGWFMAGLGGPERRGR